MKTNKYTLLKYSILFSASMAFCSCGDDDSPTNDAVDTTKPTVSIDGFESNDVFNTVPFKIQAADENGVSLIQFYINEELAKEGESTSSITLDWDSNDLADGTYTIKAFAFDPSGNKGEATKTIHVKNGLITFEVGASFLGSGETGIVFLSDTDGNLITSKSYVNGEKVTLKASDFNGSSFYLTEYTEFESSAQLLTFSNIERGSEWSLSLLDGEGDHDGVTLINDDYLANIALLNNNLTAGEEYVLSSIYTSKIAEAGEEEVSLPLIENGSSPLYVIKKSAVGEKQFYNLYPNIVVGENDIDLSLVNKPLSSVATQLSLDLDKLDYSLIAFLGEDRFKLEDYSQYNQPPNQFTMYYPGNTFDNYYTEIKFSGDWGVFDQNSYGVEGIGVLDLDGEIKLSEGEKSMTYTTSGNFDMGIIFKSDEQVGWVNFVSEGTGVIPDLKLPSSIAYELPWDSNLEFYLYEVEGVDGYDETLEKMKQSENGFGTFLEKGKSIASMELFVNHNKGKRHFKK